MDEETEKLPAEAVTPENGIGKDPPEKTAEEKLRMAETRAREAQAEAEKLRAEMETLKLDTALRDSLREAGAEDTDYLLYQLKTGALPCPELGSDGSLTDWEAALGQLKSRFPRQFRDSERAVSAQRLPKSGSPIGMTRRDLLSRSYSDRAKLFADTPEVYAAALENTGIF